MKCLKLFISCFPLKHCAIKYFLWSGSGLLRMLRTLAFWVKFYLYILLLQSTNNKLRYNLVDFSLFYMVGDFCGSDSSIVRNSYSKFNIACNLNRLIIFNQSYSLFTNRKISWLCLLIILIMMLMLILLYTNQC